MLSFLIYLLFLIPLCSVINVWWMIGSLMFLVSFMFIFCFPYFSCWGNLRYFFGCDVISYGLVLLRFWICVLIILAREGISRSSYYSSFFIFVVIFLIIILYCAFMRINLFSFYLFFEGRIIPTLFLILGWGYQPERLQAGIYLLFYTLTASLPLLVGIMYIYDVYSTLYFVLFGKFIFSSSLFYLCMVFAFLIKMPIFLVHLWLPKAHVEAPVSGSIILAGVLLKLGGYGLLRVYTLLLNLAFNLNYIWISISLVGGFLVRLICLRQTDLKSLIAYSSVAHIGVVIGGIITLRYWGFCRSYVLIIAHGLCSSGLFCLANVSYERLGRRRLIINRGLIRLIPRISMWWFLLGFCNMASPPSINLLGEIGLLNRLVAWSWLRIFILVLISFFRASYTIYIYSYSQHGKLYSGIYSCSLGYVREFLLIFLHWFPLNFLILRGDFIVLCF